MLGSKQSDGKQGVIPRGRDTANSNFARSEICAIRLRVLNWRSGQISSGIGAISGAPAASHQQEQNRINSCRVESAVTRASRRRRSCNGQHPRQSNDLGRATSTATQQQRSCYIGARVTSSSRPTPQQLWCHVNNTTTTTRASAVASV